MQRHPSPKNDLTVIKETEAEIPASPLFFLWESAGHLHPWGFSLCLGWEGAEEKLSSKSQG